MIDPTEFGKQMGALIREAVTPLIKRIDELESRQLERGEKGDKGDTGDNGLPGKDAAPVLVPDVVAELVKSDLLTPLIDLYVAEAVIKHMQANPVRDGTDGRPGEIGPRGEAGQKGDPGMDGVGLAGATIDRDGELVVTNTKGQAINLGLVVGSDGKKGEDGADFTDVELDYDGERTLFIRGRGGVLVKRLPIPIDRGYWREGIKAEHADVMTHDGSAWIALRDTSAKPGHDSKEDWRMLARKGRDGVPGEIRKAPEPLQSVKLNG